MAATFLFIPRRPTGERTFRLAVEAVERREWQLRMEPALETLAALLLRCRRRRRRSSEDACRQPRRPFHKQ